MLASHASTIRVWTPCRSCAAAAALCVGCGARDDLLPPARLDPSSRGVGERDPGIWRLRPLRRDALDAHARIAGGRRCRLPTASAQDFVSPMRTGWRILDLGAVAGGRRPLGARRAEESRGDGGSPR